jgi:[ribosomal protein S18]-alanine N-acetyltransferase
MVELDGLCFEPGIAFTRAQIGTFFDLETLEGVAAEEDGRLAGFAIGYRRRPTLAAILTLDVDPHRRRRGLGTALFRELLGRLERAGARGVRLEVDVRNRAAISFYRRFGFRRVGRLADYYGPGLDAYEMERAPAPRAGRAGARAPSTPAPRSRGA